MIRKNEGAAATQWGRLLALAVGGLLLVTVIGFFGSRFWLLDLFANFRLQYALVGGLLVIVALALGKRKTALVALFLLAANLVLLAPYISAFPAKATFPTIKVVALNLNHDNLESGLVDDFLRREKADVVVLSEVMGHWPRSLDSLSDVYPYRLDRLNCHEIGHCPMTILAKTPWVDAGIRHNDKSLPPLLWARFQRNGTEFTVVGSHLMIPFPRGNSQTQYKQIEALSGFLRRMNGPVILAGDFNTTPWSARFRLLESDSGLVRIRNGLAASWPSILAPLGIPIDHVFTSPDFKYANIRTGGKVGSDHLPVIAEIRLPGNQSTGNGP